MHFNLDTDTYLLIGYPSVAKPLNLRYGTYQRLSSAATVWERIQKPAAIYLISKDMPTQLNVLVTKYDFKCVFDVMTDKDGTQVSIDVCSMTSSTEPKVSFTTLGKVVATPYVTIRGVPVASHHFNRIRNPRINVDEAIYSNLDQYYDALHERMRFSEENYKSWREITNLLLEIALEDRLSLYAVGD